MNIIDVKKKCACCGNTIDTFDIMSYYVSDSYLDGKCNSHSLITELKECPICHYVNTDIEKLISPDSTQIVNSSEYVKLFQNEQDVDSEQFDTLKKVNLCKAYYMLSTDAYDKINALLQICWIYENAGNISIAKEYRKKAISAFEDYFNEIINIEIKDGLVYIDCLRQMGMFEDANETIEVMKPAFDDGEVFTSPSEYIIYVFEKRLIDSQDDKAYKISEVKLC